MIQCILDAKKWPKSIPKITEHDVAVQVAELLLQANFYHRSEKVEDKKGYLVVSFSVRVRSIVDDSLFLTAHRSLGRTSSKIKGITLGCMQAICYGRISSLGWSLQQ